MDHELNPNAPAFVPKSLGSKLQWDSKNWKQLDSQRMNKILSKDYINDLARQAAQTTLQNFLATKNYEESK